uniref:Uncharacterized protein n=1 Tax=Arundo donax TaxID=35708 RepID=A0A0A8Z2T7_ARUDO
MRCPSNDGGNPPALAHQAPRAVAFVASRKRQRKRQRPRTETLIWLGERASERGKKNWVGARGGAGI